MLRVQSFDLKLDLSSILKSRHLRLHEIANQTARLAEGKYVFKGAFLTCYTQDAVCLEALKRVFGLS
jgi:hypothetical protein